MTIHQNTSNGHSPQVSLEHLPIFKSYKNSPYLSLKHSSYFQVYSDLFEKYRNQDITFVEVGVLNGGSLFMWREFFGPRARIIGVELNPAAKKWENDGFEIYIGSQSDPEFWSSFFNDVGSVDLILDDGGHTYEQQIITAHQCIPYIKDGGLLVVEDTHTSYMQTFGYPTEYSFIEWTKKLIDNINARFPGLAHSNLIYKNFIYSISIFESIVSFKIDRSRCFESTPTSNEGVTSNAVDFWNKDTPVETIDSINSVERKLSSSLRLLKYLPFAKSIKKLVFETPKSLIMKTNLSKLKKYF
ncbi:class I SAM-dependent methyltransferase [Alcaligenaceae bacterium LF4-65]|uniref:Class I SAM-dependent methyltransferase n=1 Tax=Zwartia hollandica TaxID=324606 RepID=A0A953T1C7_9BURK|nr:class I SAM-dependent methyltransferase [Zwartia hollandica]MBZ1350148.1 class I SAM-dependent methyltransferase [Zwartia hollandica]